MLCRDILRGILFIHSKNRSHRNISVDNVYIVDGRAKLGMMNLPNNGEGSLHNDIVQFCRMIRTNFTIQGRNRPPYPVRHFLGMLDHALDA